MDFVDALALAVKMFEDGDVLEYGVGYNHEMGRYIDVRTINGWTNHYEDLYEI